MAPNATLSTRRPGWWSLGLMLLVIVLAGQLRITMIDNALPYPGHEDEGNLTQRGCNILKTGDFNPHYFHYPSLPIYVAAIAEALGYASAAGHLELANTTGIGSCTFPYYDTPRIVRAAKLLFAGFSLLTMGLFGWLAFRLAGDQKLLFLVPAILFLSEWYLYYSQQYVNVDIMGAALLALLYVTLFSSTATQRFFDRAVLPGLLSGAMVATKYNLGLALVPVLLSLFLYRPTRLWVQVATYLVTLFTAFVAFVPYSVLDLKTFLDHLGFEIFHYKAGRLPTLDHQPGWEQLSFYLGELVRDFGWITAPLALLGVVQAMLRDWRKTVLLLSFPAVFLLYMSQQRGWAIRNIVTLFPVYALFAGIGLLWIHVRVQRAIGQRYPRLGKPPLAMPVGLLTGLTLFLVFFPWRQLPGWYADQPDTRNRAEAWLLDTVVPGRTLLVPRELAMRTERLRNFYVVHYSAITEGREAVQRIFARHSGALTLIPRYGADVHVADRREEAAELNRLAEGLKPLQFYEGEDVNLSYRIPVVHGDPAFGIYVLGSGASGQGSLPDVEKSPPPVHLRPPNQ